ncbi:MAG: hypothetical protein DME74_12290 [Verrucomicrobia bacterium]|nr:MAG: hypothetical protein DME74_12290 [Verrucomicrobiota bacterium]
MPDVLGYSTCNQFAHGVLAIAAGPEKLVRSRIGPESYRRSQISSVIARGFLTARKMALCKSGESEIWRHSRIYFYQRVETTRSTFANVDRLLLKTMPRQSPEAQDNCSWLFPAKKTPPSGWPHQVKVLGGVPPLPQIKLKFTAT